MDDKKRRRALTDAEKLVIRKRHQANPSQPQRDLAEWFTKTTGHSVTQGQVSRVLGNNYEHLDGEYTRKELKAMKEKSRRHKGDWPALEAALFEWQQRKQDAKVTVNGDTLKEKAMQLWEALPQYKDEPMPKWSNGWLEKFKKRYNIRSYAQHGESGSAETHLPDKIAQMEAVCQLCTQYELRNVLNMDETGLNWKRTPNRTLATKASSGMKKSKDRITIALTVNADGSEKFEPWVIGKSNNPRCFKNIQRNNLRMHYRFNKAKWMTGLIFEEYLRWLNKKMRGEGRKVLLLTDNFSGHELGMHNVGGLEGLSNVRVAWLPKNTTSVWQPLDQGIIASFKLHYRKQWVRYMLKEHDAGRNPEKTINLLKTVQWTRVAWESLVTQECIQKCWFKSTCIKKPDALDIEVTDDHVEASDREELKAEISQLPIADVLPLDEFLTPDDEAVEDEDEDIFAAVVEHYSVEDKAGDDISSDEEEEEEVKEITAALALMSMENIKLWKLQKGNSHNMHALDEIEREIVSYKTTTATQTTLDRFFKST